MGQNKVTVSSVYNDRATVLAFLFRFVPVYRSFSNCSFPFNFRVVVLHPFIDCFLTFFIV